MSELDRSRVYRDPSQRAHEILPVLLEETGFRDYDDEDYYYMTTGYDFIRKLAAFYREMGNDLQYVGIVVFGTGLYGENTILVKYVSFPCRERDECDQILEHLESRFGVQFEFYRYKVFEIDPSRLEADDDYYIFPLAMEMDKFVTRSRVEIREAIIRKHWSIK